MKPPSKTVMLQAERAARKAAKAAKREQKALRLKAARSAVEQLAKRMPEDFQAWGVVRTRAYLALLAIVQSKTHNVGMTAARLENMLEVLRSATQWSLPYCRHLAGLRANSLNIEDHGCTGVLESGAGLDSVNVPYTAIYCRYGSAEQLASTQNGGQPGDKHRLARAADALLAKSGDPQRRMSPTS